MAQLISEIWAGLRDAGLPEVMLYLQDNSASRCHWDDTTLVGEIRVALLADQDRQIVRILPVDSCAGIGVASPKGIDPSGYKRVVYQKLRGQDGDLRASEPEEIAMEAQSPPADFPEIPSSVPTPEPDSAPLKPDHASKRWGVAFKTNISTR